MEVLMGDHEYLRQKANRCYQIARTCTDLDAARKINELGKELRGKATEVKQGGPMPLQDSDRDVAA